MDLARVNNAKKLDLCRWYFWGGFCLLPFLWAINSIWFFQEAFRKPAYEEQKQIRKYVVHSGVFAIAFLVALIAWIIVFQINRANWGETGDRLSFVIPVGRA